MSLPVHEVTTAHLGAAYPFMACSALPVDRVVIGRDLVGGTFCFDPFELYRQGVLTNPNMVVLGQIGRGKSSFVKSFLWRQTVFGRQAWVVDPKGEYGALAAAWGTEPVRLHPGGKFRLNPLDSPDDDDAGRRRVELLVALGSACLGRVLSPPEHAAAELALRAVSRVTATPTIPDVVRALLDPRIEDAREIRTDIATLSAMGRDLGLELRRLVEGDLKGMFDGTTTPGLDLSAPLVVLDLSAVYTSPAIGVLMTCATAWLTSLLRSVASSSESAGSCHRFIVVDEAWAILRNLGVARWLQSSWKLARAFGVANLAVLHRLSDLTAAGSAGSEQVNLATGLISDSETRVVYSQPQGEVDACRALLGISSTEADLLPNLRRGVALWKVGARSFLIEHRLSGTERLIVDTDAQIVADHVTPVAGAPRDM